ncbi:MAG: hypothetical protein AAB535_02865 [Patescibacteria group bacterium]
MAHDPIGTTYRIDRGLVDAEFLRNKLKLKSLEVKKNFQDKYPDAHRFLLERGIDLAKVREHSAKIISAGALTGSLLFSTPTSIGNILPPIEISKNLDEPMQKVLLDSLHAGLPQKVGPLERSQEKSLEKIFNEVIGVKTRATLEGEHLNTTYGYIGAEQHLKRFANDSMVIHPKVREDDEGMAPGRGAWGYVPTDVEEWYAVVQTLYLPDWKSRLSYLRDWYKYRKVLIVNIKNGNAVVAAIADAGPAAWTGKHFGGSPEVMNYLGGSRYKKGPVIVFFVDDPENEVPLGPVEYNDINIPSLALKRI